MTRYNHAYSLGFEVISDDPEGEDVTNEMLLVAIMKRLVQIRDDPHETLLDACECPWDTFECEP